MQYVFTVAKVLALILIILIGCIQLARGVLSFPRFYIIYILCDLTLSEIVEFVVQRSKCTVALALLTGQWTCDSEVVDSNNLEIILLFHFTNTVDIIEMQIQIQMAGHRKKHKCTN